MRAPPSHPGPVYANDKREPERQHILTCMLVSNSVGEAKGSEKCPPAFLLFPQICCQTLGFLPVFKDLQIVPAKCNLFHVSHIWGRRWCN